MRNRLRVYYGPDDAQSAPATADPNRVRISLGEILPLLAEAVESKRTWLKDFEDEELNISLDLYECILAYQHCRRPVA
ncbi:MAG: hypothetical protein JNM18_11035 [Planctomycetaceae bacterium]|nr:hypothetical protein [Planctomycetaceae bacterium]